MYCTCTAVRFMILKIGKDLYENLSTLSTYKAAIHIKHLSKCTYFEIFREGGGGAVCGYLKNYSYILLYQQANLMPCWLPGRCLLVALKKCLYNHLSPSPLSSHISPSSPPPSLPYCFHQPLPYPPLPPFTSPPYPAPFFQSPLPSFPLPSLPLLSGPS
jgi:hypothetical protein